MSGARRRRKRGRKPEHTVAQILAWADAHHQRTGHWPQSKSGLVRDALQETWSGINACLIAGLRGLRGGSSLARLLAEHRGVRNIHGLPDFTERQILAWADAHHRRTGAWPGQDSGPVVDAPGEKWMGVDMALNHGGRGLPGGSSLAQLLAAHRGKRNRKRLPRLTYKQVLAWADLHVQRTGQWPMARSGPIADAPGETWMAVDMALSKGQRGLPGGSSLARLLRQKRQPRKRVCRPPLTVEMILGWADAHRRRTGKWPKSSSGPIRGTAGDSWQAINVALQQGHRTLPGGSSLARLLKERRGVQPRQRS